MYENAQGTRLSLLVRHEASAKETAFQFSQRGVTNVFYWIDGPPGYALAEQINREELEAVALVVYRGLNRERSFLAAGRLLSRTSGLRRLWVHVKGADTYLPRP